MAFEAGLGDEHYPKKTAAWGDYDLDGDLDLFIASETSGDLRATTQLFRNNGDGKFTNVAPESGAQGHCFGMATVWGDYDIPISTSAAAPPRPSCETAAMAHSRMPPRRPESGLPNAPSPAGSGTSTTTGTSICSWVPPTARPEWWR